MKGKTLYKIFRDTTHTFLYILPDIPMSLYIPVTSQHHEFPTPHPTNTYSCVTSLLDRHHTPISTTTSISSCVTSPPPPPSPKEKNLYETLLINRHNKLCVQPCQLVMETRQAKGALIIGNKDYKANQITTIAVQETVRE